MDRQNQRYNLLDEIDTEKDDWNIRVRVTRMWEVLNIKTNSELMSVDLVLLDEKDNLIHASIRKSFVNHVRDIQEGKIYRIKYFGVVENKDAYRIVNHKYMIRFYATTSVKLLETNDELIAKQKFELVPFDELKYLADKNTTLTDVIGEIVGISPMEKIEVRGKKLNKRLIELQDNRREKIRITFWDKFAEAINEDICFDNSMRPIIIITSTTVNWKLSLSSTNSAKLYVNLDIPEVIELRKSLEETEFSLDEKEKKIESLQLSRSILDPNEISKMKRTLLEILTFIKTEKEQVSIKCARYRLDMQVGDTTEHANFVVFDKEAEKLIKVPAMQLSNMEEEDEDDDNIIPSSIKCIIGKTYIFQLKITAYNFFVRKQNFTVTRVIEIEGNGQLQETTKRGANNGNEVLEEKISAQVKKRKIVKK
ncbi:replication protein A 70 kDa DNA-binding subunit C [Quercus suber]|uniref:replication protein A 70 kDa DNA-binding subunit C n=1 Tax=Quercus suber TaxID=58331 RepID=UPI000CE2892D|nr:replication protein A 70 kDa DNA-binding subunit C-like [Quercus suber]